MIIEYYKEKTWSVLSIQVFTLIIMAWMIYAVIGIHEELYFVERHFAWPSIEGIVSKLDVDKYYANDESETLSYEVIIEYSFQVNGKDYTSNRRTFESLSLNNEKAAEIIKRYKLDEPVTVYYDPENPRWSVLEKASGTHHFVSLIICYVVCGGAFAGFIYVTVRGYK